MTGVHRPLKKFKWLVYLNVLKLIRKGKKNVVNKHTNRYNPLPLLRFRPGGVHRELAVCRPPGAKVS